SVDKYWNLAPIGRNVMLTSNDIYAEHPASQPLGAGEAVINGFLPSAATSNLVINAVDDGGVPALTTQTDSGITVNPGAAEKMIVVLLDQYLVPGKMTYPYGVDGTISTKTAGNPFTAMIYAADSRYNKVGGVNQNNIKVISNDPFAQTVGFYTMTDGSAAISGITLRTEGDRLLTAQDFSGDAPDLSDGQPGVLYLSPNNPTNLRVLLPGESREPGSTGNGRKDPPDSQKAGVPFDIVVDITDSFWNLIPGASQEIRLLADDPFAIITPSTQTVLSSATFTVMPKRAGPLYLTAEMKDASPDWGPTLSQDISSEISVSPGTPSRLLLVMPGEDFEQGSDTGKSGEPSVQKAGNDFAVKVGVVDSYYNLVLGWDTEVEVNTPTDSYAENVSTAAINTLLGYTGSMYVTMKTAATHDLTATDFGGTGLSAEPQSSTFTVTPDDAVGLQLLMPGEVSVPGAGDYPSGGKTVNTSTQTAGTAFVVTVNLVDKYMNRYKGLSVGPTVYADNSDVYDMDPSNFALNYGTVDIPLNLVTKVNSAYVKIFPVDEVSNYVCNGNLPANTVCKNDDEAAKSFFKVYASTAIQIMAVLPGESLAEGRCDISPPCKNGSLENPGKTGFPTPYAIGSGALYANVYLVDKFYNKATEHTGAARDTNPIAVMPDIKISLPQDAKESPPSNQTLTSGSAMFTVYPKVSLSTY
ncbi:MAG: hypothetical protein KAI33_06355, partial [Elusimicrobiales bacterium]|nr:hypothetical protein [Elusimicrobiales bacterium]